MTSNTIFAVFEDFNEPRDEPPLLAEDDSVPFEEVGEIRKASWTEGYLSGRQESGSTGNKQPPLAAKLLTSVHELASETSAAVDAASLVVADLLVKTVIAATSDGWSARLLERVRMVADRIKPALAIAPEFMLRDDQGTEHCFADISDLSRALETGTVGEDVTIRWQRGEAAVNRMAFLEDLREAIIPLSIGRINEQDVRGQP